MLLLPEGVGAALYLICGAIFPVTVLPGYLEAISKAVPLTWWLEAMRRGLLGAGSVRSFSWATDAQVMGILVLTTLLWVGLAAAIFGLAERRARWLGILDQESGF